MGRGDEVDVVAPHFLEFEHGPCHFRGGDPFTPSQMADVVILAENTPKIAVGEKDRSRTVISDQRGLLTKVGKGAGDHEV